jgi:AraC-like DNA-binding protein
MTNQLWSKISHAAVVYANYAQFGPGMKYHFPQVESRMLVWCINGTGKIRFDGEEWKFTPGSFFISRWKQSIAYEADTKKPFLIGGIHVIPWHDPKTALTLDVSHHSKSKLAGMKARRDIGLPELKNFYSGNLSEHPVLAQQAEYVVGLFETGLYEETVARALGPLVLWQWITAMNQSSQAALPTELAAILSHVKMRHLKSMPIKEMADIGRVSPSTVLRLFRDHLQTTPRQWLLAHQMEQARRLLETSTLRIGEIARAVGISDVYYFSHWFKRRTGMSPKMYRERNRRMLV